MRRLTSLAKGDLSRQLNRRLRQTRIGAVILAIVVLSGLVIAAQAAVFGPQAYNGTGRAVLSRRSFTVTSGGSGYTLRVQNGGVLAALVVLNGRIVLRPSDFRDPPEPRDGDDRWEPEWDRMRRDWRADRNDRTKALIEKPVTLRTGTNEILVAFISRTGTSFTLDIFKPTTDTTPPVITTIVAPSPNANGWNNTNVTVTFTCTDTGSGVATCPTPITVATEGANQIVSGTATDKAGNQATASVTLNVDKGPPVVSATASPNPNGNGWNNSPLTVTFSATDVLSGVAPGTVTSPVVLSADGMNLSATGQAMDLAGNIGTASRTGINIDTVAPTLDTTLSPPANSNGWNNTPVTVHFTCSDSGSGIATCPSDQIVSTEGPNQTVGGTATDRAGNARSITGPFFNIDQVAPTITVTLSPAPNSSGVYTSPVTAHFTCADAASGVASCPTDQPFTTAGSNLTATGTVNDRAGNVASITSDSFTIVLTLPTITVALSPPPNANGWRNVPVTAHFTCSLNGAPLAGCPPDQVITADGANQTVRGSVTDPVGQTASVTSEPFSIDTTLPTAVATITPSPNAAGWNNTPVTVRFSCNDSLSGVAGCPEDQERTIEGAGQTVAGTVSDRAGNARVASAIVNVDRTPPTITLSSPTTGNTGTTVYTPSVTLSGTVADTLSGLAAVTCNGTPATVVGGALSCVASLTPGVNVVEAIATDRAGNSSSSSLTFTYVRVPIVAISTPANLSYTNITPTTVTGTVDDVTATVTINSIQAPVVNGAFSVALPLAEGPNLLTATATTPAGASGTATLTVTLDTTPPRVTITSPPDQFITTETSISVAGNVNDIVVGTVNAEQAGVRVNGDAADVANRTFLRTDVPLTLGPNTIQAVARDRVGNQATTQITVVRQPVSSAATIKLLSGNNQSGSIGAVLPVPLEVRLTDSAGNPAAGRQVIFKVIQNDGLVADAGGSPASSVAATTDAEGRARVQWTVGRRAGAGGNSVEAYSVGFAGTAIFTASGTQGVAGKIVIDTGNDQIGAIGQPLPKPFIAVVVDDGNNRLANVPVTFRVHEGGGTLHGQTSFTLNSDPDGRVAATLTLGMQEGNANNLVSATIAGNIGSAAGFTASGRAAGDPAKTTITGVVLDNSNQPIPGVTIRAVLTNVLRSNLTAVQSATAVPTNAQGQFSIPQAPVGFVKLLVDGSTAQLQGSYPDLEYDIVTVAGQTNTVGQPIYLLPLNSSNQLCVTPTTGGGTLTIPEAPGFSLTFGPGQVTFPGGSKTGCVSVTVVNGDKVPMMPGFGQQPRFIVTIQPAGAAFSPPAPITLPNVDGLKPREVTEMYSFDHDIGSFVAIGTGTVSEDGLVIRSTAGVGVLKAGWHCGGNPNTTGGAAVCPICFFCPGSLGPCMPQGNGTSCGNGGTCQFGRGCVGGSACSPGYTFTNGRCCQGANCVDPTCPPAQHPDPSGTCVNDEPCPPSYTLAGGQCCRDGICFEPSCPAGQVFDPNTGSCQTVLDTCTPQTAGQFCNAGGGTSSPGRCNAAGGCEGNSPDQCSPSSGCSACTTTPENGQQCTQCSNGQPPVNGQCCSNGECNAPTVELRTWDGKANPIDIFVRVGGVAYRGGRLMATVTPSGGTFEWTVSAPSVVRLVSNASDSDARFEGVAPGISTICLRYTAPDQQTAEQCTFAIVHYPFVFVHGFNSSAGEAWGPLAAQLHSLGLLEGNPFAFLSGGCMGRQGFDSADVNFCAVDYSKAANWGSHSDPGVIARTYLDQAIGNLMRATGAPKVVILAHSMGGLVSRYYIETLGNDDVVDRLITIGTPHKGTVLADLISNELVRAIPSASAIDPLGVVLTDSLRDEVRPDSPAVAAMQATGVFVRELNLHPRPANTQYVSLIGSVDRSWNLVTRAVYDYLRKKACNPVFGGDPNSSVCNLFSDYDVAIGELFANSDALVPFGSQIRSGGSCTYQLGAPVMHAPRLKYRIVGVEAFFETRPIETESTNVFLAVLGLSGTPICPR